MSSRFPSHLLVLIAASFLLIAGSACSANSLEDATVGKIVQSSDPQRIVAKEVREIVCNCGEAGADIRKKVEQSYTNDNAIHWEFRGEVGFGASLKPLGVGVDFAPALETIYGKEWSASRSQSVAFELPANPGSQMEYRIQWVETWQPGTIEIRTNKGVETLQYYYLRGIEANLVDKGGRNLGCSASCQDTSSAIEVPTSIPGNPVPTSTTRSQTYTDRPSIVIENRLALPITIVVDGDSKGTVPEYSSKTYLLDRFPVSVDWEIVKETRSDGVAIGDDMRGRWSSVDPGMKLFVTNKVADSWYFYPIVTNNTDTSCRFSVNDGWKSENRPGGVIPSNHENVHLGYYRLFSNSNLTIYCDQSNPERYLWWGIRPDQDDGTSFLESVGTDSGIITFTLRAEVLK